MAYTAVHLNYFTGTGNSYRAACWMAEHAENTGVSARVAPINAPDALESLQPGVLFGLLYPVHGFSAPWTVIRFALGLPNGRGIDAFTAVPRGAFKFGGFTLPGMEGTAGYLIGLILALKGYRLRGSVGLDMPGSWTTLLPGQSQATTGAMLATMQPKVEAYFAAILNGQAQFRSLIPLALGLLLLPISILYLLMGRFFLAKLFYASARCNHCGQCVRGCPVKGVVMKNNRPYWTFLCESCTRCMNYCPRQAVEASYPFGALVVFLTGIPLFSLALDWLAHTLLGWATLTHPVVEWIINYPYKLLSIAAAYYLFSLMLRVPLLNALLTRLTPTFYYRRYHDASTSLKDIQP